MSEKEPETAEEWFDVLYREMMPNPHTMKVRQRGTAIELIRRIQEQGYQARAAVSRIEQTTKQRPLREVRKDCARWFFFNGEKWELGVVAPRREWREKGMFSIPEKSVCVYFEDCDDYPAIPITEPEVKP